MAERASPLAGAVWWQVCGRIGKAAPNAVDAYPAAALAFASLLVLLWSLSVSLCWSLLVGLGPSWSALVSLGRPWSLLVGPVLGLLARPCEARMHRLFSLLASETLIVHRCPSATGCIRSRGLPGAKKKKKKKRKTRKKEKKRENT